MACSAALWLSACASAPLRESLDDKDRELQHQTIQEALESGKVGEARNWENPDNGHRGTVTPTETYAEDPSRPCRDYQTTVTIEGKTETTFRRACRDTEGQWTQVRRRSGTYAYRPYYGYPHHHFHYPYYHPYYRFGHHHGYHSHSGFSFSFGHGF